MTLEPGLVQRFAAIVGARHALTRAEDMHPYLAEPRGLFAGRAGLVLLPASTAQVSAILALASETRTAIVPQGGNTGLVGGQIPDGSGQQVVVCLRRMNRIREIDPASNTVTAEAGVVLQDLQAAAEAAGRLFPLALASQGSCQIGGNLSSNAGGTEVLAYGNARDLCLGLEVVLPDGRVLDDLRKLRKDNTGYDLRGLFIGAEGTLGIITAAVLRLFPLPAGRVVAWLGCASPQAALELYHRAAEKAGPALTAFELMNDTVLSFSLRHGSEKQPPLAGHHPWHVLMEYRSHESDAHARSALEEMLATFLEAGLLDDAAISQDVRQLRAFWALRENMSESQKHEGASLKHDISVPVARIPALIEATGRAVRRLEPAARIACFGHMGDGNLHYNISQPEGGDGRQFSERRHEFHRAVHDVVATMGGSFSAEHGIGQMKREELARTASPVSLELMSAIKRAFDPLGIMNPGKVLDVSTRR
jgi:FAD/FMN-containing dehydrogenase